MSYCISPPHHGRLAFICAIVGIVTLLAVSVTPQRLSAADGQVDIARSNGGMVVSDSKIASRIGRDILLDNGNAVDAAVATAFALAVSWPEAGNIGGGGFMLVRPANGQPPVCIDYREIAPQSMQRDSFQKSDTTYTHKAVGVPGTVRGLALAHTKYGRLRWSRLVMPASKLAAKGVPVDQPLANSLNSILSKQPVRSDSKYAELRRVYGKPDGSVWQPGDRLVLPDLARTLEHIAQDGPDAFYEGSIAKQLVEEMKRGDGLISLEDLSQYKSVVRPAMKGTFRGYTVLGAPPPSSGGTCIIEALNILENFNMRGRDRYNAENIHLIAETCKRVFADRARYLGDPAFTKIPEFLTSKDYAREVAQSIDLNTATPSEAITPEIKLVDESPDTTHFSIVDSQGMAVSNTYTLEASWGSRVVVKGAGFLLNNEMGDFNWFPGETNRVGRIGTEPNTVLGGKRMLSSMSPTMLEKDGQLVLVTGSPGGRTIINTVLGIILGITEFHLSPAEAVTGARMHHQWFPDRIELEDKGNLPHSRVEAALVAMGHAVGNRSSQGSAHTIAIDSDAITRVGIADYRRSGGPAAHDQNIVGRWDFDGAAGTDLSTAVHHGKMRNSWTNSIHGSSIDGAGCLQIKRSDPDEPLDSYLPLNQSATKVSVEFRINQINLTGRRSNEKIRIGFTSDRDQPKVAARVVLARNPSGHITIRGEALGRGTVIPPVVISQNNRLDQPIVIRLELDTTKNTYQIASRNADSNTYKKLGIGKVAPSRPAKYLRLSLAGDFTASTDVVKIDWLKLNWDLNRNNRR